ARDYRGGRGGAGARTTVIQDVVTMATKKKQQYIVGVDLGGTNIVVGAMSADGKSSFATRSIPTGAESGAEGVADRIVGLIEGVVLDTIAQPDAARRDFI